MARSPLSLAWLACVWAERGGRVGGVEREQIASLLNSNAALAHDSPPYKSMRLDFFSNGRDGKLYANGEEFHIKVRHVRPLVP